MKQNNDTYTFFSILAFVAAILVFAGIVGGGFELESVGWLVLVLLAAGVGLMGAAMAAGRGKTSTAVVPTKSTPSGSSLTVPGTEVASTSAQSTVPEEVTSPEPPKVSDVPAEQSPATDTEQRPDASADTETPEEREAAAATGTVVDDSSVDAEIVQPGELTDSPSTTPQEKEAEEKVMGSDADANGEVDVTPQRDTVEPDDLTKLEGIGPKMSEALISGGVTSFEKLSQMSLDDIRAVLDEQGQRFAPAAESWAEQASLAAKEDWDGLETLQSRLVAGRYPTED